MRQNCTYPVFLILLLTVALTGCRREPMPCTGAPIIFSVSPQAISSSPTKAEDLSGVTPPARPLDKLTQDGSKIKVWGNYTMNAGANWTNIFTAEPFTLSSENWDYTHSTPGAIRRWVEGADYRFLGAYPADNVNSISASSDQIILSYDMANDYDLMVAAKETSTSTQAGDAVNLTFQHACAAIRFIFRKGGNETESYSIKSFRLNNLRTTGTLTQTYDGTLTWAPGDLNTDDLYSSTEQWSMTNDYSEFNSGRWYFVVPQDLPSTGSDLPTVTFSYVVGSDSPVSSSIILPATKWEAGKLYVYYIAILPDKSTLGVQIEQWDTYLVSVDDIFSM